MTGNKTMATKEKFFEKISRALSVSNARAPYPQYADADLVAKPRVAGGSAETVFRKNFAAAGGVTVSDLDELKAELARHDARRGVCDPALTVTLGGLGIEWATTFDRQRPDDYAVGATIASGAIAETGSLILKDRATCDRLAALAPWTHIAVVKRADIFLTLPEALARLGDDPYVVFATGPSKTADVEGILIQGVHGPGAQIAWLVD
jgi:L-lactate dehydrogenase complex protein LldG